MGLQTVRLVTTFVTCQSLHQNAEHLVEALPLLQPPLVWLAGQQQKTLQYFWAIFQLAAFGFRLCNYRLGLAAWLTAWL